MTVMKNDQHDSETEQVTLKKEQAYIRQQLGVSEDESDSAASEECNTSGDDDKQTTTCPRRSTSIMSSDGGYVSSSDECKSEETSIKNVNFTINHTGNSIPSSDEVNHLNNHPFMQLLIEGLETGLPDDYRVPIDNKPAWLDMKKFKIGQKFAQDYYFGLNVAEMFSLLILFAIPDELQPLIYTGKSGTPFTAFRRYLSTVLRIKSWFEHDVWDENSVGYRNLKTVRAMHLNASKHLNSIPYNELEGKLTVRGPDNNKAVWCTSRVTILEDFKSGCPFNDLRMYDKNQRKTNLFFNQVSMTITQFAFVGLMVTYPEKFGAASAREEELDGLIHLWRGLGYLLGIEDKYNFCNGSLQEVRKRCEFVIENIAKPQFQKVTEDWEHMSRCFIEGIGYYTPGLPFETSLLYLCWVLDVPTPRFVATMTWYQYFLFILTKMTLCFTLRLPGMRPLHNWIIRKSLKNASSWSADKLHKLESKTYDYEKQANFNTRL